MEKEVRKNIFVNFPGVILLAAIIWHFFIAKNGFEGFETTATLVAFYYLASSIYFYYLARNDS